jgi:hypothetical protein
MGIRFYCPNGHKLNVKEFQRGLKGICPTCGAAVHIPLKSTRRSSRAEKSRVPGMMPTSPAVEVDPAAVASLPAAVPPSPESIEPGGDVAEEPSELFSVFTTPTASCAATAALSPLPSPAAAAGPRDALAEASGAAWFVRPPSGGQFGPATADVLRSWLAEGRLTADTLVWREGWQDWRAASELFPQLSPKLTIPGLEDFYPERDASAGHDHSLQQRDRPRSPRAVAIGVVILIGLFFSLTVLALLLKLL